MNKVEKMPSVSIIIPIYNAMDFLKDSIGDIRSQTYTDFELICVDDGSTDGSSEIIDEFEKQDSRIKAIHQLNAGGGAARNKGLDIARGKYILSLDADDRFEPNLLERIVSKIQETGAEIVAFGGDVFETNTGRRSSAPWLLKTEEEPSLDNPLEVVNTTIWNKLILKDHIRKHDIRFQENMIVNNMYFVFLTIVYANKISTVTDILVHYRTNNAKSAISNVDKWPEDTYDALVSIYNRLVRDNMYEKKKKIFLIQAAEYITSMLRTMKTEDGFLRLYNAIHDDRANIISVSDIKGLGEELKEGYLKDLIDIKEQDAFRYLHRRLRLLQDLGISRKATYILPLPIQQKKIRAVLYGGGNVGKDYFLQIIKREDISLVGWVDANYSELGYPLQSPMELDNNDFDIVILSVLDKWVANSIKDNLIDKGIVFEKIYWEKPIVL